MNKIIINSNQSISNPKNISFTFPLCFHNVIQKFIICVLLIIFSYKGIIFGDDNSSNKQTSLSTPLSQCIHNRLLILKKVDKMRRYCEQMGIEWNFNYITDYRLTLVRKFTSDYFKNYYMYPPEMTAPNRRAISRVPEDKLFIRPCPEDGKYEIGFLYNSWWISCSKHGLLVFNEFCWAIFFDNLQLLGEPNQIDNPESIKEYLQDHPLPGIDEIPTHEIKVGEYYCLGWTKEVKMELNSFELNEVSDQILEVLLLMSLVYDTNMYNHTHPYPFEKNDIQPLLIKRLEKQPPMHPHVRATILRCLEVLNFKNDLLPYFEKYKNDDSPLVKSVAEKIIKDLK